MRVNKTGTFRNQQGRLSRPKCQICAFDTRGKNRLCLMDRGNRKLVQALPRSEPFNFKNIADFPDFRTLIGLFFDVVDCGTG